MTSVERGQQELDDLMRRRDEAVWSEWEKKILYDMANKSFGDLTTMQRSMVTALHDKLMKR